MLAKAAIYLDANAGAPLRPEVVEALLPLLKEEVLSNPSSIHSHGRRARRLFNEARERVAASFGAFVSPDHLIFTSSGSEANQTVIRSVFEPLLDQGKRPHWILSPVEHDSVLQMVRWLEGRGGQVSYLSLDSEGVPQPDALERLWKPETALVSVIWVNNETGAITPIQEFSREVEKCGGMLHLDGAQAWGKIPLQLGSTGAHWATFSGHKIGAMAGTGVLWHHPKKNLQAFIRGKQQKGLRGGTENLLGAVSLGVAAGCLNPESWAARVAPLRDRLEETLRQRIPNMKINAQGAARVANTSSLSFLAAENLVMQLDLAGFSVSAGSACSSGITEPSHVLLAMGRSREEALSSLRISFAQNLPWNDLERLIESLASILEK